MYNEYYAFMQGDGNFVIYLSSSFQAKNAMWATGTYGPNSGNKLPFYVTLQTDGNLLVFDKRKTALWSTDTWGRGPSPHYLVMESDGNLVLYDGNGTSTWTSGSSNYHICH